MFPAPLRSNLRSSGIIAVLVIDEVDTAVPLARALREGGVGAMELTLRTPVAMECLRRIRAEVPEMAAGVGTVLTPGQVNDAREAGAVFGVAPGCNPRVIAEAERVGLPFAPGICTPTDVELAVEAGCRVLKFFPAEPSGGLSYLKAIAAPFGHLGVQFLPLGGVGPANAATYLEEPAVLALGGSWLAPREAVRSRDWAEITRLAREASDIVARFRHLDRGEIG